MIKWITAWNLSIIGQLPLIIRPKNKFVVSGDTAKIGSVGRIFFQSDNGAKLR